MQKTPPCTRLRSWRRRQRTEEGVQKRNRAAGSVELFNQHGANKHFNTTLEIWLSIRPFCLMPKCHYCSRKPESTVQCEHKPLKHTHTHTHIQTLGAHGHFSHNSAWLPLPDWQETGRVRTTSCEYRKRQKIIENLAFMNLWWERVGDGWSLPLVKSEPRVCIVCMTANKGWDKQGLDRAQTTANPAVENICPCN